ncbi:hypothetical protein CsSME_00052926 [Camellia sinensis var. sinensis]
MWNSESKTLEDIIGSQQMSSDKSGIGYGDATQQKGKPPTAHDKRTQAKGKLKIQQDDKPLHQPKGGMISEREVKPVLFVIIVVGMATFALIVLSYLVECLKKLEILILYGL